MYRDTEACFQALAAHDRRFDGKFFTAVITTGIYCRPICPARPPLRKNIRFYPCAAAAESNGFRPCKRCRPDTAPGSPAWVGTSATVRRALRLIAEGKLSVDKLGVGDRHLRRLFQEELGASPQAIAHVERLHFARKLIEETTLPLGEIAFHDSGNDVGTEVTVSGIHFAADRVVTKDMKTDGFSNVPLIEFGIVAAEAAVADQFDDDDVEGIKDHRDDAANEPVAKDEQRDDQPQADDDQFSVAHAGSARENRRSISRDVRDEGVRRANRRRCSLARDEQFLGIDSNKRCRICGDPLRGAVRR